MRVRIHGVMAAVKSSRANIAALLLRDFFGCDEARRIAGPRRGNRRVVWMRERVPQSHAGLCGFGWLSRERVHRVAHDRRPFYTDASSCRGGFMPPAFQFDGTNRGRRPSVLRTSKACLHRQAAPAKQTATSYFEQYEGTIYTVWPSRYLPTRQLNRGSG